MSHEAPFPIVVLFSGQGTNLQAIIDKLHKKNAIKIEAVITNEPEAGGIARAKQAGIPWHIQNHRDYISREAYDNALSALMERYQPKLIVLAGFMRILSPGFVTQYLGKMINAHPSLLPKYPGKGPYTKVLEAGDPEHGSTIHFVTENLDQGPIIMQGRVPVFPGDTVNTLKNRVKDVEHIMLPLAIQYFAAGKLCFKNNTAYYEGKHLPEKGLPFPHDLNNLTV